MDTNPAPAENDGEHAERSVQVDAPPDEVWEALVDDDERAAWFGGATELETRPGGDGYAEQPDGSRRRIRVDEVDPGRRLAFEWWTTTDDRSYVEIVLEPAGAGTRVDVTETRCSAGGVASPALMVRLLDLELLLLCRRLLAVAR